MTHRRYDLDTWEQPTHGSAIEFRRVRVADRDFSASWPHADADIWLLTKPGDGQASLAVVPSVAMRTLAEPTPSKPMMFGAPAPPGDLLPWSWAQQRLIRAQNYWIATTRPDARPHCRPVWGVWLPDGFWFSTGSLAAHNLALNDQITVHLEDGQEVVIVEGTARPETDLPSLQAMCDAYSAKYHYPIRPTDNGAVQDSGGLGGPARHVIPEIVFGWDQHMASPTRWAFDH